MDAMQYTETFVSVTFIDTNSDLFLVCKNSDKFYHRKIMWAANEKLTINKLGLKDSLLKIFWSHNKTAYGDTMTNAIDHQHISYCNT